MTCDSTHTSAPETTSFEHPHHALCIGKVRFVTSPDCSRSHPLYQLNQIRSFTNPLQTCLVVTTATSASWLTKRTNSWLYQVSPSFKSPSLHTHCNGNKFCSSTHTPRLSRHLHRNLGQPTQQMRQLQALPTIRSTLPTTYPSWYHSYWWTHTK